MTEHAVRPYLTAGVAVLAAGVIAVSPVTPPPSLSAVQLPAVQLTGVFDGLISSIYDVNAALAVVSPLLGGVYFSWPPLGSAAPNIPGYFTLGAFALADPLRTANDWIGNTLPAVQDALTGAVTDPATEFANLGTALTAAVNELFGFPAGVVSALLQVGGLELFLGTAALNLLADPVDALNAILLMPTPLLELPIGVVNGLIDEFVNDLPFAFASAII